MTNPDSLAEFQLIRDALEIPRDFSAEVLAEAEAVARRDPLAAALPDLQAIPFITIDPPSSQRPEDTQGQCRRGQGQQGQGRQPSAQQRVVHRTSIG